MLNAWTDRQMAQGDYNNSLKALYAQARDNRKTRLFL